MKNYVLVDVSAAIHSLGLNDSCVDNYLFFNPFNHTKWLVYGIIYVPEQTPHEQLDYHFNTLFQIATLRRLISFSSTSAMAPLNYVVTSSSLGTLSSPLRFPLERWS